MPLLTREAASALRHLAVAIDADRGAHLFLDRGDGVLDLIASVREGSIVVMVSWT